MSVLSEELTTDPRTRGYSAMSDQAAADDLNTVYRERNLATMTGDAVFEATVKAEFAALTEHKQSLWMSLCGRETIDPFGRANVDLVKHVFGAASDTVTALAAERKESISRAEELGLRRVKAGHVEAARS